MEVVVTLVVGSGFKTAGNVGEVADKLKVARVVVGIVRMAGGEVEH